MSKSTDEHAATQTIEIQLNGERYEIAKGATVSQVVASMGERPERLAIELNGSILPRDSWVAVELKANDQLEVVQFVGGGSCLNNKDFGRPGH